MTPVTSNLSISNPREFLPSAKYKYTPSNSKKLESFKTKKDQIICKIFKKNKAPLYPCYIDKSSTKCLKVNCKIAEAKLGNIKSVREKWFSCLSPKVDNSPSKAHTTGLRGEFLVEPLSETEINMGPAVKKPWSSDVSMEDGDQYHN